MMHPDSRLEFISKEIGFGVFATKRIPKGTITYALDELELVIDEYQYDRMNSILRQKVDWFSYRDENNRRVVSWDMAKYVNHSCHSNTMSTGWGFEIALRDIEAGEEITDDYGLFMGSDESMPLGCGEQDCRRIVSGRDRFLWGEVWDGKIREALDNFTAVDQPLLSLLNESVLMSLQAYLQGKGEYRSVCPVIDSVG